MPFANPILSSPNTHLGSKSPSVNVTFVSQFHSVTPAVTQAGSSALRPQSICHHRVMTLDPIQLRVLGALIEKEIATPENYPLSLNALVNACNQRSSRDPVLTLTEDEVRQALHSLEDLKLTTPVSRQPRAQVRAPHPHRPEPSPRRDRRPLPADAARPADARRTSQPRRPALHLRRHRRRHQHPRAPCLPPATAEDALPPTLPARSSSCSPASPARASPATCICWAAQLPYPLHHLHGRSRFPISAPAQAPRRELLASLQEELIAHAIYGRGARIAHRAS